jgi:hypothetical protein
MSFQHYLHMFNTRKVLQPELHSATQWYPLLSITITPIGVSEHKNSYADGNSAFILFPFGPPVKITPSLQSYSVCLSRLDKQIYWADKATKHTELAHNKVYESTDPRDLPRVLLDQTIIKLRRTQIQSENSGSPEPEQVMRFHKRFEGMYSIARTYAYCVDMDMMSRVEILSPLSYTARGIK